MSTPELSKTLVLDPAAMVRFLWGSSLVTALVHHTDAVAVSPGAVLKAAEWYNQALSLCAPVAAYRQVRYGTQDSGSFDVLEVRTQMGPVAATRAALYADMCRNAFMYMAQGPGPLGQYLDHVAVRTEGQKTALDQWFAAVHRQNDTVRDAIDRMRRRTYVVRVTAEVAMVLLGAGPISLGVQIGVGLGYALVTTVISSWSGMSKADIVAMPAGRVQPGPEGLGDVAVSNAASTGMNVVQELGGNAAEAISTFELARQRALAQQAARIEAKIEEVAAKSGANRDYVSKAALNTIKDLTRQGEEVAARRAAPRLGAKGAQAALGAGTKAAGVAVGIYFLREDIGNVISFFRSGDL